MSSKPNGKYLVKSLLLLLTSALLLPALFSKGMFLDGLIYGAIGRNLAEGLGSFWTPYMNDSWYPVFHEHPPLGLWLGSLPFRFLGDFWYVERLWALVWLLIFGKILYAWAQNHFQPVSPVIYLFLLMWLPAVGWAFGLPMLEIYFLPLAWLSHWLYSRFYNHRFEGLIQILIGGVLLAMLLIKGLVCMYPLAFPFWYALFLYGPSKLPKAIFHTALQVSVVLGGAFAIYWFNSEAAAAIDHYLNSQLINSLNGSRMNIRRSYVLEVAAQELVAPILISLLLFGISYKPLKGKEFAINKGMVYLHLAMGLSAILPIMISPKQMGFYALPSLPYFAAVLLLILAPRWQWASEAGVHKAFRFLPALMVIPMALMAMNYGKVLRDHDMLNDLEQIHHFTGNGQIGLHRNLQFEHSLKAYAVRYFRIDLNVGKSDTIIHLESPGLYYERINLETRKFHLYYQNQP